MRVVWGDRPLVRVDGMIVLPILIVAVTCDVVLLGAYVFCDPEI